MEPGERSALPTCVDCAAAFREGEPVYSVLRVDSRAEGQLTSTQVVEQIRKGLLTPLDHVAGRGSTYVRVDQHADFAPYFIPSDPHHEGLVQARDEQQVQRQAGRRRRLLSAALRALGAAVAVAIPVGLWQAGVLSPENPAVARGLEWASGLWADAELVVAKALDEEAAMAELEERSGLPADELLARLQAKWPEVPGEAADRIALAQVGILQGTRAGRESARGELEAAFVAEPENVDAIAMLAVIYLGFDGDEPGLRRDGLELFQRATELAPDSPAVARGSAAIPLAAKAWGEAAEKSRACLELVPGDPSCSWYLGHSLMELGEFQEATEVLLAAAEAFEDAPVVDLVLGRAAMESHRYREASEALSAFAKRYPDDPDIHQLRARLLHMLQRHDEALASARLALKLGPDRPEARLLLGMLLTHQHGAHAEAAAALQPLVDSPPADREVREQALLHASIAARRAGRSEQAVAAAQALCAERPGWAPGQLALALALAAAGDEVGAEEALQHADDGSVPRAEAARLHMEAARFYEGLGRERHALFALEAARDASPGWMVPRLALARAYLKLDNPKGALQAALITWWMDPRQDDGRDAIRDIPMAPVDIEALRAALIASVPQGSALGNELVSAVAVLGAQRCLRATPVDCAAAELELKRAFELSPESVPVQVVLGRVRLARGDAEGALELLEPAVASAEEHPAPLILLGQAYAALGRLGDVERSFERALLLPDDGTPMRWRYAEALLTAGEREAALEQAKLAASEDPGNHAVRALLGQLSVVE